MAQERGGEENRFDGGGGYKGDRRGALSHPLNGNQTSPSRLRRNSNAYGEIPIIDRPISIERPIIGIPKTAVAIALSNNYVRRRTSLTVPKTAGPKRLATVGADVIEIRSATWSRERRKGVTWQESSHLDSGGIRRTLRGIGRGRSNEWEGAALGRRARAYEFSRGIF